MAHGLVSVSAIFVTLAVVTVALVVPAAVMAAQVASGGYYYCASSGCYYCVARDCQGCASSGPGYCSCVCRSSDLYSNTSTGPKCQAVPLVALNITVAPRVTPTTAVVTVVALTATDYWP